MASIYQRGDIWWISWKKDGKHVRRSLKTSDKNKAKVILNAKEIELSTGHNVLAKSGHSFEDFCKKYLDWHAVEFKDSHERTYQIVHQHLLPTFGPLDLSNFTGMEVEEWKQKRRVARPKPALSTINKELRTLQAVFNKAVEWNVLARNPIKGVKGYNESDSKPKNFYIASQLADIYAVDPEHASIWKLLANTGLRRAEAMNLRWDNILDSHVRVLSTEVNRTKSRKWRDIPISPGCRDALKALRAKADGAYVLPRFHKGSLSRSFSKAVARAGLEGSLHDLRHTFISLLVMQNIPLRTVQVLAGHSNIKTTEGYAHLAPAHMMDAVAGLNV